MGGLRLRHRGRRARRRDHAGRHAAQLHPADHHAGRAAGQAGGRRGPADGRRRLLGRRGARQPAPTSSRCGRPGSSASSASWRPPGVEEFPPLDPAQFPRALRRGRPLRRADDRARRGRRVLEAAPSPPSRAYADFVLSPARRRRGRRDRQVLDGARETGARVHVLHLSSARALDLIADARAEGLPVTVETCPHYLCFAAETIPDAAPQFKCCPPIRDAGNREELWAGAARRHHRHHRQRPLPGHRRGEAPRRRRPAAGLGRRLRPAGRLQRGRPGGPAPRHRAGPGQPLDVAQHRRPGRAGAQGPDRGRRRRRRRGLRHRRRLPRSRPPGSPTATRSRPTTACATAAGSPARWCAATRSTSSAPTTAGAAAGPGPV